MMEYVVGIVILLGSLLILISAVGILKMPDIYLRMSATTKAATLGVGAVLVGAAMFFKDVETITIALVIIIFLLLTAPVAAHMIGRASYIDKIPMWKRTGINELEEYNKKHN